MDIQAYFDRIGFKGAPKADLATLRALHRRHSLAISYENLDVQLGRPVTIDPAAAFAKIVHGRRGGWCYEMNGLLGAVLEEVGFKVTHLAGGVHRAVRGDEMVGNHLVLLVEVDGEPWIADVGFGDGPRDPYPLREGPFTCDGFVYRLERLDADWWRLNNHPDGGAPSFDFTLEPADPARLAEMCGVLQTAPTSIFVMTAIAQRHLGDEIRLLRGRAFRRLTPGSQENSLIDSAPDFVALLKREFELDVPEAATIWDRICARHDELFPAQPA
ncbi:arylamine N-acetyltransferase [uncultured Phenylobacterium sp.]|uniref:arylamine N-acetyltransferase family protein n=1 Tax=uncultured Phenylobacterium sp. TaxID=349273 RepID=UPI0025F8B0CA|nr:arylamine N-acetyltransferase [uncultured Phenylobacterium sp.]